MFVRDSSHPLGAGYYHRVMPVTTTAADIPSQREEGSRLVLLIAAQRRMSR